jgi:hypothetical protein
MRIYFDKPREMHSWSANKITDAPLHNEWVIPNQAVPFVTHQQQVPPNIIHNRDTQTVAMIEKPRPWAGHG